MLILSAQIAEIICATMVSLMRVPALEFVLEIILLQWMMALTTLLSRGYTIRFLERLITMTEFEKLLTHTMLKTFSGKTGKELKKCHWFTWDQPKVD